MCESLRKFTVAIFILFLFLLIFSANILNAFPVSYDLRKFNRVTSVKNQGIPGPCWAFAALGSMESNFLTQYPGNITDLSEMHLAYYMYRNPKPEKNFTSWKKSGTLNLEGNIFMATAFLSRLAGPVKESSLEYSSSELRSLKSNKGSPENYKREMILKDVFFMSRTSQPDNNLRKKLIQDYGGIVISFYSNVRSYHSANNSTTYFNPEHGNKTNHDVIIIGWDDNYPRENFKPQPSRDGAWLIKNSWGVLRGSGGYFWLSYDQFIYGGAVFVAEKNNSRLKHYGYDDLGWCGNSSYKFAANIFKIDSERENLSDIGIYTPENNINYEIKIYDLGNNKNLNLNSAKLLTELKNNMNYAGYHKIKLNQKILLEQNKYIAVVVKMPKIFPVELKREKYSEKFIVNAGESYFSNDGINWTDGFNLKMNACIKIFTETRNY